jgi:ubiquinone/menaquinone biosynthesis C-methylase UbiE
MTIEPDSGAALRALYEPSGGVRAVFSAKVADYVASRPNYPSALFDTLAEVCALRNGAMIADVGAGTGLLTRGWLERGYEVVAVEPNPAMRGACDRHCGAFERYRSVEGTAEAMPLAAGSVDLVTAAQAFHWFDVERARRECLRVLVPHGKVALVWNDRDMRDPLHTALDEVFKAFGGEKWSALVAHEDRSHVRQFFGAAPMQVSTWPHRHSMAADALVALAFSRSYMPERSTAAGQAAEERLRHVFARFAANGAVNVRYETVLFLGRPA